MLPRQIPIPKGSYLIRSGVTTYQSLLLLVAGSWVLWGCYQAAATLLSLQSVWGFVGLFFWVGYFVGFFFGGVFF